MIRNVASPLGKKHDKKVGILYTKCDHPGKHWRHGRSHNCVRNAYFDCAFNTLQPWNCNMSSFWSQQTSKPSTTKLPQQKNPRKVPPEPIATLRWMRIIVFTYTQKFMVFLGTPRGIISKVSIFRSRWRPSRFAWLKDLHCFLISACWQHGQSIFRCLDDF